MVVRANLIVSVRRAWTLPAPQANVWGCKDRYGDLDVVVMPYLTGMVAYTVPDTRGGCPAVAAANTPLIQSSFTVTAQSLISVSGHMIRNTAGRADLQLFVDGMSQPARHLRPSSPLPPPPLPNS